MKLEDEFHIELIEVYKRAKSETGYNATRFLQMISAPSGGYVAAKKLIIQEGGSGGFTNLWELHRLDLTVEAGVIKDEYASLFSDEEIVICKKRLINYGYELE